MSNPLNDLPFDINELRVQDEFNWDCVDGIDQIHKDILKAWERIVLSLTTPLAKVQSNTLGVGQNIADYTVTIVPQIQQSIDKTDESIKASMLNATTPLTTKYGTTQSKQSYYLVWRQRYCNQWYPAVELWSTPPNDRTWYGPYDSSCALIATMCAGNGVGAGYATMPSYDPVLKSNLDQGYHTAIQLGWGDDGNCDPTHNCGLEVGLHMQQMEAALNCTYPNPVTPPQTSTFPYTNVNGISCEDFHHREWSIKPYLTANHDLSQFPAIDLPLVFDSDKHYLTKRQYDDYETRCVVVVPHPAQTPITPQVTNDGTPSQPSNNPPVVPVSVNPSGQPPQVTVNPVINIPQQGGFSVQCCDALVNALTAIASTLTGRPQNSFTSPPISQDCGTMLDDKYMISECAETDQGLFIRRLAASVGDVSTDIPLIEQTKQHSAFMLDETEQETFSITRENS